MTSRAQPLVSIVILNWNGLDDTKLCLKHVRELEYKNFEIIVVDNGSKQAEKEYLSRQKDIVFVDNPKNRGFTGGQIDGFTVAKGDFILLLNNDAIAKPDFIHQALRLFDDEMVGAVGGRAYFWNDTSPLLDEKNEFYSYMEINTRSAETTILVNATDGAREVNSVSGSAVLVRRDTIEKIGYLHEPFFAYYEETDLFARMKRAGYKVMYSPDVQIWHKNGSSSGSRDGSSFFFYHIFRNRFMYAIRNFENPYVTKFVINYLSAWLKSQKGLLAGSSARRLAVSYSKAVLFNLLRLPLTLYERNRLARNLPLDYVSKLIGELTRVSYVLDATLSSEDQLKRSIKHARLDDNPLHEYIFVTNKDRVSKDSHNNIRFVNNMDYFKTHPINLGVIVSGYGWVVMGDCRNAIDPAKIHSEVSMMARSKKRLLYKTSYLVVEKSYYQKFGGLAWSKTSLEDNFVALAQYASLDSVLSSSSDKLPDLKNPEKIQHKLEYDNWIQQESQPTAWSNLLAHNYRLQQLSLLVRWILSPYIPFRLKGGRLRNVLLFAIRLNRGLLATELRYMRNELQLFSKNQKGVLLTNSENSEKIQTITQAAAKKVDEIPIFIICFERIDSLNELVDWLESQGLKKIVFIDNSSSYPPLLDYLSKTPYQVLQLAENAGHTAPWSLGIIRALVPDEYYIVSDPDVIPSSSVPRDAMSHFIDIHTRFPGYIKVGFGLKIDDLPDHYPLKKDVITWESQFWKTKLEDGVYEAGVDTTFALYKPFSYKYTLHPSIRLGEPYTARHTPWYADPKTPSAEDIYYRTRAKADVTSWNVDELPERYKKALPVDNSSSS